MFSDGWAGGCETGGGKAPESRTESWGGPEREAKRVGERKSRGEGVWSDDSFCGDGFCFDKRAGKRASSPYRVPPLRREKDWKEKRRWKGRYADEGRLWAGSRSRDGMDDTWFTWYMGGKSHGAG